MTGCLGYIGVRQSIDSKYQQDIPVTCPLKNKMCQGLNSHYFHIIRDGHQPNSRGNIPIIRIPIKGGMTIPNIATFDHGTNGSWKTGFLFDKKKGPFKKVTFVNILRWFQVAVFFCRWLFCF